MLGIGGRMSKEIIYQTSMLFRVRKRDPMDRVFLAVHCGINPGARPLEGELILDVGEFQSFFTALRMGTQQMVADASEGLYVPLEVTVQGERLALGRDDIPDEVHFPMREPPWAK